MSGYAWAKTAENELFVVMVVGGRGYVPGVGGAIDLTDIVILEPVLWPSQTERRSQVSDLPKPGARAAGATPGSNILPFAANG